MESQSLRSDGQAVRADVECLVWALLYKNLSPLFGSCMSACLLIRTRSFTELGIYLCSVVYSIYFTAIVSFKMLLLEIILLL